MNLLGNKEIFGIQIEKDDYAYQMSLYVNGQDILQFEMEGVCYPYRWRNFKDIIEWIQKNLKSIISEDECPLVLPGDSAVEIWKSVYKMEPEVVDMDQFEILQDWMFRHSWFSARAGSYVAEIFFRKKGDNVEISWDNSNTFKDDGVKFVFPVGKYEVGINDFQKVMEQVCYIYSQL